MTLLAALIGDGRVLVGADARTEYLERAEQGHATGVTEQSEKVWALSDPPLLWGAVGSDDLAKGFVEWLTRLPIEDWSDLKSAAQAKVAEINGLSRTRANVSMGSASPFGPSIAHPNPPLVAVLLAGYVAGKAAVVVIDESGGADLVDERATPMFVGPFAGTARVAWRSVERFNPDISFDDPDVFASVLTVPCEMVHGLWVPVHVWVATPGGCSRVAP